MPTVNCVKCGEPREITEQQMLRPKYTGLCTDCNRKSHKGSGNPNWKNGQRIGGQDGKYILNYAPEHPQADSKGYVLAHRLVGEEMLGRPLYPEEVPHHLDFNPQINDPSNIIILSNQASHVKLHKYLEKIALIERAETLKEVGEYIDQQHDILAEDWGIAWHF